jgi:hypothetical protein
MIRSIAVLMFCASGLSAMEIATGRMLGSGYDRRSFYVRQPGRSWEKTYSGPQYRREAAGRLMNLRIAQALFHDEWLKEFAFDPEKNTDAVIEALDTYKAHGILAITVSLQGGNAGYAKEFPAISRATAAKPGPGKGMLVSAFRSDGTLKEEWKGRLLRLARALDQRGMILDLAYFYQGQDEVLSGPKAIRNAVEQATDFLIENDVRNVIIEIANEVDIKGFDHDLYIERNLAELIRLARSRFDVRVAPFRLPVSASTAPAMRLPQSIVEAADLTIVHGNNKSPEFKRSRILALRNDDRAPGPVYMNEDNNGRDATPQNLALELRSLNAVWEAGGSWGYMPWRQAQMFPFRWYNPVGDEPEPAYFRSVLAAIRDKVMLPEKAMTNCPIDEDLSRGAKGAQPLDAGIFTAEGWRVQSENTQMRYDLGGLYSRGTVEIELKGPLYQLLRRAIFSAVSDAPAPRPQGLFQVQVQRGGMSLRLVHGESDIEAVTQAMNWSDGWYRIRARWDTRGSESLLWLDGRLLRLAQYPGKSDGFRWFFLGRNGSPAQLSVPGVVYRRLKVCVEP